MTKILTCQKCFEAIEKKSSHCAEVWLSICKVFYEINKKIILVKPFYYKELRTLEMMKFILTTDVEEAIAIRVLGEEKPQGKDIVFCGGRCDKKNL